MCSSILLYTEFISKSGRDINKIFVIYKKKGRLRLKG